VAFIVPVAQCAQQSTGWFGMARAALALAHTIARKTPATVFTLIGGSGECVADRRAQTNDKRDHS
jgi:hypothetical protein